MEEKIKVMILEIDHDKRRISLGLKQTKPNPWTEFSNKYGIGDKVEGNIKSITDFGIFVGLEIVFAIDAERERISLKLSE